jgi:MFS transporter, ACS family, hexuronate transporter
MRAIHSKWKLCLLLFLATTLNYLDRQTLGILAPLIQQELGLDNRDLGWLFAIFYYSYTFAQFAVGGLLDRWNLRWAYAIGVLAWSCSAALTALATGFAGLLFFRLLLGVTESVNWPAAMRVVARVLPPEERSLGNGIFTSGTSIGALIAPSLILGIASWLNWRWAFVLIGSLGLVWIVLWATMTRNPAHEAVWLPDARKIASQTRLQGYGEILRTAQFWRVFVVAVLVNPCLYFLLNWLPTYFSQQWDVAPAGLKGILTLIFLGLDLGYLFCGGGILSLTRRGWRLASARQMVFLIGTVLLSLTAVVPFAVDLNMAVALLVLANFGAGCWIAMYLTMAQEVSATNVSTAAGLLGGSGSLAGALAMWAVGEVTHETSSFAVPLACIALAALLASVAGSHVVRHTKESQSFCAPKQSGSCAAAGG